MLLCFFCRPRRTRAQMARRRHWPRWQYRRPGCQEVPKKFERRISAPLGGLRPAMPQLRGISTSLVLRRPIQSGVAVPTGLCRRTPKAVAFRGAPPNWRMSRQRLALWSAVAEPRSGADTAFARDCAQKFATVRAKAASPSLRDSAAALQRLSLMATSSTDA